LLSEWYLDLQTSTIINYTCAYIEQQITEQQITEQTKNSIITPPIQNERTETTMSSQEDFLEEILTGKAEK